MGMPTLSDRAPDGDNLHTIETCASEVLALRLALSLIEAGAEPAGVMAAIRKRDAICQAARRAIANRAVVIAQRTGITLKTILEATAGGPLTPGEARAILAAFAGEQERADPAGTREEEWLPPEPGKTPDLGGED